MLPASGEIRKDDLDVARRAAREVDEPDSRIRCIVSVLMLPNAGALRYYYPDFVLRLADDTCLIVETKGQEDLDVALKDRRARRWCKDATRLSGRDWTYEKVPQKLFDSFNGDSVEALRRFLDASGADS